MMAALTLLGLVLMTAMLYAVGGWGLIAVTLVSLAVFYTAFGLVAGTIWIVLRLRKNRQQA